jgi:hypothetical protein
MGRSPITGAGTLNSNIGSYTTGTIFELVLEFEDSTPAYLGCDCVIPTSSTFNQSDNGLNLFSNIGSAAWYAEFGRAGYGMISNRLLGATRCA